MGRRKREDLMPAIPPDDYEGSQAAWMVALMERGLWDGNGWHGDVYIDESTWWEILEECEDRTEQKYFKESNFLFQAMKKQIISFLKGLLFTAIVCVVGSLAGGTLLWFLYPSIHAVFPGAASSGIMAYRLEWTTSVAIMMLIELIFRLPFIYRPFDIDEEEEEEEEY